MYNTIGFIGCGNMGSALALAAAGRGTLLLADARPEQAQLLARRTGGTVSDNETIARSCDLIFLGVKPQMMARMLEPLRPVLAARKDRFVLVSMAAGMKTEKIQALCGKAYPVIRIMPNVAVAVGAGVIQVCDRDVTDVEVEAFCTLMERSGLLDRIDEHLIDAASGVSGCGPAYICLAMEAMADGGVACGLSREKALRYAAQTLLGVGKLYLETGTHPGALKDSVTSPGGTTIQGVRALENRGVRAAFFEAVVASYEKNFHLES